jgi:HSP20 family protein
MATLPENRPPRGAERTQPLRDVEQVTDRMRRLLDESFGGWTALLAEAAAWTPPVDIEETDDAWLVEAELPGVDRKDIDIELVGNELAITGEIKERERAGILRRKTRRVGRFEFRVTLPDQVDQDKIEANVRDGVLTVRVPKAERAQRRRIEVTS